MKKSFKEISLQILDYIILEAEKIERIIEDRGNYLTEKKKEEVYNALQNAQKKLYGVIQQLQIKKRG